MISLAYRDISHTFGRYLLTGIGLGLLIGVTLTMAGVFRGMVDDGKALLRTVDADIWVVQQNTLGPFAEPSSLPDDIQRGIVSMEGVKQTSNVAYLTMEISHGGHSIRVMLEGIDDNFNPIPLVAGRPIMSSHYEIVADERAGFKLGEFIPIHRHNFRIVGITTGMRSPSGDPMLFLPLKDAQEIQFLKDNDAIFRDREQLRQNPKLNPPNNAALLPAVEQNLFSNNRVNVVLVRLSKAANPKQVAENIEHWLRLTAYTNDEMEDILIGQLIAMASKQIGLFLVILTLVSAAIVALTIYSMTQTKLKEIAVLKLIGTRNGLISRMILLEAVGLGIIGFITGKLAVTYWAPLFPKHIVILGSDTFGAFLITIVICILASIAGIRAAISIPPGSAIDG